MVTLLQRHAVIAAAIVALLACSVMFIGTGAHALNTSQYTTTSHWSGHNTGNGGNHNWNTNNNNWTHGNHNNGGGNWNHHRGNYGGDFDDLYGLFYGNGYYGNYGYNGCYQSYWNGYMWVEYYTCGYGYGGYLY